MDRATEAPCGSSSGQEPTKTTVLSTTIEWNFDMETTRLSIPALDGQATEFSLKGRCKRCWGALRGRADSERELTGIKCMVCGRMLAGAAAASEDQRISQESFTNAVNLSWGLHPSYGDGPFAWKVLPNFDRQTEQEFVDRITRNKSKYAKSPKGKITRHDFSPGSPGWLFLQARVLVDGVGYHMGHGDGSIADFPDYDVNPDGSVSVHLTMDGISENPRHKEHDMLRRMGALMGSAMTSAFACELALKAIALTCNDEARKTHDLLELSSRISRKKAQDETLVADYPARSKTCLNAVRTYFGKWRYFDAEFGRDTLNAMIDTHGARNSGEVSPCDPG